MSKRKGKKLGKKGAKKLRSLYWAEVHIGEAKAICILIREWKGPPISPKLSYGLWTGIVVSYCRSFGGNKGLSGLDEKFSTFPDAGKQALHKHLIKVRNILFAHKDSLRETEVLAPAHHAELPKIRIIVAQDGSTEWEVKRAEPPADLVTKVEQLCEFQIERLNQESSKMLGNCCQGRSYEPGTYVLGEKFP
jgi:hypothetical protein